MASVAMRLNRALSLVPAGGRQENVAGLRGWKVQVIVRKLSSYCPLPTHCRHFETRGQRTDLSFILFIVVKVGWVKACRTSEANRVEDRERSSSKLDQMLGS